ncbi:DUF2785 domain-containing protein [Croceicoccus gelatinilyticus]|uniref:DUF2785 domain-containing protein n=1 Tax=Croceicoccus gelatinilyticus TaxID=2835536 RepID=UPI001BCFA061|nr:DUF2785 domain-containing protein [Croceicoccus gelatinilyticus]MBS7670867.1 DUF2785 domain-containing protein [Croceicoccus gelatinilyticus]
MSISLLVAAAVAACPLVNAEPDFDAVEAIASGSREDMAGMVACLGEPDPVVRDEQAYSAFVTALREGRVTVEKRGALMDMLAEAASPAIEGHDEAGFLGPFAVLVMAEVARTDRIEPWLDEDERYRLARFASLYLESVTDYRGFVQGEGWRHGVAHGADLLMQLALNPELDRGTGKDLLAAILPQVAPTTHAYRFGEPARLARPVIYLADQEVMSEAEWEQWFDAIYPEAEAARSDRYRDEAALTRMHNARAFALEIMAMSGRLGDSPAIALADHAQRIISRTAP